MNNSPVHSVVARSFGSVCCLFRWKHLHWNECTDFPVDSRRWMLEKARISSSHLFWRGLVALWSRIFHVVWMNWRENGRDKCNNKCKSMRKVSSKGKTTAHYHRYYRADSHRVHGKFNAWYKVNLMENFSTPYKWDILANLLRCYSV